MTTEMTVYTPAPQLAGMSLNDAMSIGQVLAKSGFFSDAREAAQAVTKVLAGQELGIGPVAAMTGVYLVNGRVAIGANLMAAAVKRSRRYNYRVTELSDARCAIEFTEEGKPIGESVFTIEDARKAQTKNIDKFPRNMLFARAMSNGVRWFCPDVFSTTVYTPDELRGDVLESPPAPTVVTVNTTTGEIVDEPIGLHVQGIAGDVKQGYSKAGALTVRFILTCPEDEHGDEATYDVIFRNAPDILLQLENGDEVLVDGSPGTYKGAEVVNASAVQPAAGYELWQTRAAAAAEPAAA